MTFLHRTLLRALFALGFLVFPVASYAQVDLGEFSLTWNGQFAGDMVIGDCFDLHAGPNAGGITLDIIYQIGNGPYELIDGWPTLDSTGTASNICIDGGQPLGPRAFVSIRDHAWGSNQYHWFTPYYWLNISAQPTGASYDPTWGFNSTLGLDSYVFHVSGAANQYVRIRYYLNGWGPIEAEVPVDGYGNFYGALDHYTATGTYEVIQIQHADANSDNWVSVYAPFTGYPPMLMTFTTDKSTLVAGGANGTDKFRMFAANGADVAIDYQYSIGGVQGIDYAWPYLYYYSPGGGYYGRSSEIQVSRCTNPANHEITYARNHANGWQWEVHPMLTLYITGAGPASYSGISPVAGARGQVVDVTISGQNLCGVTSSTMTTNYPGVTISDIHDEDWRDGTSMTARLTIAANAALGNAPITLKFRGWENNPNQIVTIYFGITPASPGGGGGGGGQPAPAITSISPTVGGIGSTVTVTIAGTNLTAPTLSTTYPGLTFTNVVPATNGNSLTAKFVVSSTAQAGTATVKVTTPGGFATGTFNISAGPWLSREYIYLGDRAIAVVAP